MVRTDVATRMVAFPPPDRMLSLNDRDHHQKRGAIVAEWRKATYFHACAAYPFGPTPRAMGPSTIRVALPFADERRRDPHNYVATAKVICDALCDAGFWPDDTPEWVSVAEPVLYRGTEVVVVVEER